MSCHDIGRGLNSVVKKVIELLKNDNISKEAAKQIIIACRNGVYWCDGNECEAVACFRRCYCGNCMEHIETGKPLYSIFDVSLSYSERNNMMDIYNLAADGLCEECFSKIINQHCNDENAAEKQIQYIKENCREYEYTSEDQENTAF